jgi:hypothetical protein
MNMTLSPPIKILALIGVLAIVAFGASTMLLGHSSPSTARTTTVQRHGTRVVHHVPIKTATHSTTAHAATKPAAATKHTSTASSAKAATKTHAKVAAKPAKPAARGNLVYADLPAPLQRQLAQHKVVVVSLYNPNSNVDAISVAEAHAGAVDVGAGFLLVSVLNNAIAGPLTSLLPGGGLLPDPGVLVYRAPGDIMVRLNGFADRASVAQAVTNAKLGQKPAVTTPTGTSTTPTTSTTPLPGTTGAP